MIDHSKHPCFSEAAKHSSGRIHLPVAPRCNMQCNFCNRKYDCLNESHPGVTSAVLTPDQALRYLRETVVRQPRLTVVGLAGPGDPFANPEETMQTLRLVRREFPEMILCVATNGLAIGPYIEELASLQVSHVTITINAVDPIIASKIYSWIRDGKRPMRGEMAGALLLRRQLEAICALKRHGITVKVNSIIIPGINDGHIIEIARTVSKLGVDLMNCMPMAPVEGAVFQGISSPEHTLTESIRQSCKEILPQMNHCTRCRADAAGLLTEPVTTEMLHRIQAYAHESGRQDGVGNRPYVAVASCEGTLVNQHLGEAASVLIFGQNPENPEVFDLKEHRVTPESGSGDERWIELAKMLVDCRVLLVKAAGPNPKKILSSHGLKVIEMEGFIEEALAAIYSKKNIPKTMMRRFAGCLQGISCRGNGTGCG